MCHKLRKHFLILLLSVSAGLPVFAQTSSSTFQTKSNRENAPYSRFGVGEYMSGLNTLLRGMGSISSAYANPYAVNTDNPASYASLLLTAYEGGVEAHSRNIRSGNDKYNTGMATIANLNIGFPIGKNAGMSFGYKPMTHTYYNLQDTSIIPGYGNSVRTFFGDGALNYAYIGAAGKYKGFSVGANFGYLFGTTVYASRLESIDATQHVNDAQFSRIVKTGGIYWKGGAQYQKELKNELGIRAGATLTLQQTIQSSSEEYWITYGSYSGAGIDTAFSASKVKGSYILPMQFSAGLQLYKSSKWTTGIDFTGANWSQFRNYGSVDSVTSFAYKVAAGAEYTPDALAMRKYFSRVTYRLGFYYGKDYVQLRNTSLNYYAVTAGLSLPFKRSVDRIHTSIEIGRRGTQTNGLISESFVRFAVGITLNDKWFVKRKYD